MIKIAIAGINGRMGRELAHQVVNHPKLELVAGSERVGSEHIGKSISDVTGVNGVNIPVVDSVAALVEAADAIIDFTRPDYTIEIGALVAEAEKVHIIGTTGLSEGQEGILRDYALYARIVYAGNMSLAVNLLAKLTALTSQALDDAFDIEILEMHHKHKVDAPSGTALMLGKAAAKGRNVGFQEKAVLSREGHTGARKQGDIGFATLRGADVVGEHTVIFAGEGERIELKHISTSRDHYAKGALVAALWAKDQPAGLYSMQDVLGL
jgi:4-hydroxy-tetrahydrodipicolinate reductase